MQITAFRDGTVLSGRQRKSLVLKGQRVVALCGWTGLATIGSHNTGVWLHGQLDAMRAVTLPIGIIAKALAENATLHFAALPQTDKRCSFAVGGLFVTPANTIEPFLCRITNCECRDGATLPRGVSAKFEVGFELLSRTRRSKHPYLISIMGDERTALELALHWRGLRGLLKRRADIRRIGDACLQIARAVADKQEEKQSKDPSFVKTVGKNLLLVAVDNLGAVQSLFFSEDGSLTQVLAPDVLSTNVSTRDVVIDSRINADGATEIKLRGWFKVDRLPGQNDPPQALASFSAEPPAVKLG